MWLDYIKFVDKSNAKIDLEKENVIIKKINNNIIIKENKLFVKNEDIFDKIKDYYNNEKNISIMLSFPKIILKKQMAPLFLVNIEDIFFDKFKSEGWDLLKFEFTPSLENIREYFSFENEELEKIQNIDSLLSLLYNLFNYKFSNLEEAQNKVENLNQNGHTYFIENKPYMFAYEGEGFNKGLKSELNNLLKNREVNSNNLGNKFLTDRLKIYDAPKIYLGAIGEYYSTYSQSKAIFHTVSNGISAIQGPPGTGKTTLITNIIANQVVKRALELIINKKNINNLTVITSTNNQAVMNAIERLEKSDNDNNNIFLITGKSKNITEKTIPDIEKKIDFLNGNNFDEDKYYSLQRKIKCIYEYISKKEILFFSICSKINEYKNRIKKLEESINKINENINILNVQYKTIFKEYKKIKNSYQNNRLKNVKYNIYFDIFDTIKYYSSSFSKSKGILWFFKKLNDKRLLRKLDREIVDSIRKTYDYEPDLRISRPSNIDEVLYLKEKLESILNDIESFEKLKQEIDIKIKDIHNIDEKIKNFNNRKEFNLKEIKKNKNDIISLKEKVYKEIKCLCNENQINNYNEYIDFFDSILKYEDMRPDTIFKKMYSEVFFERNKLLYKLSKKYLLQYSLKDKNKYISSLGNLIKLLDRNNRGIYIELESRITEFYTEVSLMFPVITTTLQSVRNFFKYIKPNLIDKTLIDEAGIVLCHQAFPIIFRSKAAVVVGDPKQIQPIIPLNTALKDKFAKKMVKKYGKEIYVNYSPVESKTAYDLSAPKNTEEDNFLFLEEHFRCQKDIADYFNKHFYNNRLIIKTRKIHSDYNSNLVAYHVDGRTEGNVNVEEVKAVKDIVDHLTENNYYKVEDIGILSPYYNQAKKLKRIKGISEEDVGTIHTFQGSEKKVIICSTKIHRNSDSSYFLETKPNILNVAVSRAQELFILVGNLDKLNEINCTEKLIKHIDDRGQILEINTIPKQVQKYAGNSHKANIQIIKDCYHIEEFYNAINNCKKKLIVISPWITGESAYNFIEMLKKKIIKNPKLKIKVIYGWKTENKNNKSNYEKNNNPINELKKLNNIELIDACLTNKEGYGTHEKIIVCDDEYAVIGSWNWLSHKYTKICRGNFDNKNFIIRHETSIKVRGRTAINELNSNIKERFTT